MPTVRERRLTETDPERLPRLARFAAMLTALTGWKRWTLAWLLGLGSVLALPPVGLFPVLFAALPALVWQIDGTATRRAAFAVGWWFGLGHFMAGTYWISNSLLVEADRFAWLIPPTLIGVSAYLAIYPALACAFARWMRPGWARIAALAVGWTALEMLRGVAFTGFPWNPIGSIWSDIPAMLQPAAAVGVFGLGLLTVALAAAPAMLARGGRAGIAVAIGVPLVLAGVWGGGTLRIPRAATADQPGIKLGIVPAQYSSTRKSPGAVQGPPLFEASRDDRGGRCDRNNPLRLARDRDRIPSFPDTRRGRSGRARGAGGRTRDRGRLSGQPARKAARAFLEQPGRHR